MAIKLSDCPPALHAAIMRQLEREGRNLPVKIVKYCMAYQVGGQWSFTPETEDFKAVAKQVDKMNNLNARTAAAVLAGKPTAVMVKSTRTAILGASK